MKRRQPISVDAVTLVAAENAGHPLDAERAAAYAEAFEPIMQLLDELRSLPLKNVEPATIFRPEASDEGN